MRDKIICRTKFTWLSSSLSRTLKSLVSQGIRQWEQAGLARKNSGAVEKHQNKLTDNTVDKIGQPMTKFKERNQSVVSCLLKLFQGLFTDIL